MIFEDDFILAECMKTVTSTNFHMNTIMQFMNERQESPVSYRIGCLPLLLLPVSVDFHHYSGVMTGTHAVVYNKSFRTHLLKHIPQTTIKDWDVHCNYNRNHLPIIHLYVINYFPKRRTPNSGARVTN